MARRKGIDFSKLRFVCASTDLIAQLEDIVREFFSEVLEMSFDDCLVTDESDLGSFLTEDTPVDYEQRFRDKYGFDLEAVGGDLIVKIAAHIARTRTQARMVH